MGCFGDVLGMILRCFGGVLAMFGTDVDLFSFILSDIITDILSESIINVSDRLDNESGIEIEHR